MSASARRDLISVLDPYFPNNRDEPTPTSWDAARIPSDNAFVVVADGYRSTSESHAVQFYTDESLGLRTVAFSYFDIGCTYSERHTQQIVEAPAETFAKYIKAAAGKSLIPLGISGGAVPVILGTALALARTPQTGSDLAVDIPCIVLIAPGLSPAPQLYPQYLDRAHGERVTVPPCILQLCDLDSEEYEATQAALQLSFATIGRARIPIKIVYWQNDILTPYPWASELQRAADRYVHAEPIEYDEHRRQARDVVAVPETIAAVHHLRFCRSRHVIAYARTLIQQCHPLSQR